MRSTRAGNRIAKAAPVGHSQSTYTVHATVTARDGRGEAALADLVADLLGIELKNDVGSSGGGGLGVGASLDGTGQRRGGGAGEGGEAAKHGLSGDGYPPCQANVQEG